jgi:PhnB protein
MKNLNPYLGFNGQCEEAFNFYKECFGGTIGGLYRYSESPMANDDNMDKIMHGEFTFWGGTLFGADLMESCDPDGTAGAASGSTQSGNSIHLSLGYEDADEMQKAYDFLKQGGRVMMELADQFWGARFGTLTDKFGINWMFNCPKPDADK